MNVNARGDKLDANGNVISTRAEQVNRNLDRTTNAVAGPIPTSSRDQKEAAQAADQEKIEKARVQRQAAREQGIAPPVTQPTAGLAAALARASKITDEE
jgi:hypothetical protein